MALGVLNRCCQGEQPCRPHRPRRGVPGLFRHGANVNAGRSELVELDTVGRRGSRSCRGMRKDAQNPRRSLHAERGVLEAVWPVAAPAGWPRCPPTASQGARARPRLPCSGVWPGEGRSTPPALFPLPAGCRGDGAAGPHLCESVAGPGLAAGDFTARERSAPACFHMTHHAVAPQPAMGSPPKQKCGRSHVSPGGNLELTCQPWVGTPTPWVLPAP